MTETETKLPRFARAAEAGQEIAANGPLNWAECLKHLGRSEAEIMHRLANGRVSKAVVLGGRPVVIEVAGAESGAFEARKAESGAFEAYKAEGGEFEPRKAEGRAFEARKAEGGEFEADEARVRADPAAGGWACREREASSGGIRPEDASPGPCANAALRVGFPHDGDTPELRAAAADYVREWFGLDEDLRPFCEMARRDALLAPAVAAHAGLRLIGIPDLFEALVWSVIGQQITLGFAYTMKKRLVETYGEALSVDPAPGEAPYRLFPRPERLAALTPDDLRPLQFSGRKAEYIIGIARMIEEGRLSKSSLAKMDENDAREALLAIRGVGAWTADYVGMKCLRRASAFPATDAGLHQALRSGLNLGRKPLPAEIARAAAPWRGHEAYAVFYLWHTLLKSD